MFDIAVERLCEFLRLFVRRTPRQLEAYKVLAQRREFIVGSLDQEPGCSITELLYGDVETGAICVRVVTHPAMLTRR